MVAPRTSAGKSDPEATICHRLAAGTGRRRPVHPRKPAVDVRPTPRRARKGLVAVVRGVVGAGGARPPGPPRPAGPPGAPRPAGARTAATAQPVSHLLADVAHLRPEGGDVVTELSEEGPEALGVVLHGVGGLVARSDRVAALAVLAADDAVVLAALDPLHDLGDAPDRVGVGGVDLVEEAADAVVAVLPVLVLHRLGHEGVEVELVGGQAGGHH